MTNLLVQQAADSFWLVGTKQANAVLPSSGSTRLIHIDRSLLQPSVACLQHTKVHTHTSSRFKRNFHVNLHSTDVFEKSQTNLWRLPERYFNRMDYVWINITQKMNNKRTVEEKHMIPDVRRVMRLRLVDCAISTTVDMVNKAWTLHECMTGWLCYKHNGRHGQ